MKRGWRRHAEGEVARGAGGGACRSCSVCSLCRGRCTRRCQRTRDSPDAPTVPVRNRAAGSVGTPQDGRREGADRRARAGVLVREGPSACLGAPELEEPRPCVRSDDGPFRALFHAHRAGRCGLSLRGRGQCSAAHGAAGDEHRQPRRACLAGWHGSACRRAPDAAAAAARPPGAARSETLTVSATRSGRRSRSRETSDDGPPICVRRRPRGATAHLLSGSPPAPAAPPWRRRDARGWPPCSRAARKKASFVFC